MLTSPLSSFYGRIVEGIFATEAEVSASADQGFATAADGVGRFKYSDINGDNVINDDDRTFIGSPHPDFTYGFNLTMGYKVLKEMKSLTMIKFIQIFQHSLMLTEVQEY